MSGHDFNRFVELTDSLADDLKCGICLNVFNRPVDTQCGHTFCRECVERSVQFNGLFCPLCRQQLRSRGTATNEAILENNNRIDKLIGRLRVKCDFEGKGCKSVIRLRAMDHHLEECDFNECDKCRLKVGKKSEHICWLLLRNQNTGYRNRINNYKRKLQESDIRSKQLETINRDLLKQIKRLKTKSHSSSGMSGTKVNIWNQYGIKVSVFHMTTDSTFDCLVKHIANYYGLDEKPLKLRFDCHQSIERTDTLLNLFTNWSKHPLNAYFNQNSTLITIKL